MNPSEKPEASYDLSATTGSAPSKRGRPRIPDGTRKGPYVRVMGCWIWQPMKGKAKTAEPIKRRPYEAQPHALFHVPAIPSCQEASETRLVCVSDWREQDWIIFMQDGYADISNELPTFFPSLLNT